MKTLEKVSDFVGKYMAAIVIVVAAGALFFPGPFSVVKTSWVNTLLGIVMFGMGLTLKPNDFKVVFSRPKDVIVGCVAQFTLMPFLAWVLTMVFHLPTELAIGVILVGTCPGGTSSNVMTYLSKGDVALSVGMTAVSTVLAPVLTPLLTLLYAGQRVDVNPVNMFLSIVKVVLVPIVLGFVVNHFFHEFTQQAVRVLPLVSTTAIVLIICAVVSANSAKIMTSGLLILVVVVLHNLLGYLTGYAVGKALKLDSTKCRAISIEVGMQNSGLATSLAAAHFAQYPLATIPGAVFSVWLYAESSVYSRSFLWFCKAKDQSPAVNGLLALVFCRGFSISFCCGSMPFQQAVLLLVNVDSGNAIDHSTVHQALSGGHVSSIADGQGAVCRQQVCGIDLGGASINGHLQFCAVLLAGLSRRQIGYLTEIDQLILDIHFVLGRLLLDHVDGNDALIINFPVLGADEVVALSSCRLVCQDGGKAHGSCQSRNLDDDIAKDHTSTGAEILQLHITLCAGIRGLLVRAARQNTSSSHGQSRNACTLQKATTRDVRHKNQPHNLFCSPKLYHRAAYHYIIPPPVLLCQGILQTSPGSPAPFLCCPPEALPGTLFSQNKPTSAAKMRFFKF